MSISSLFQFVIGFFLGIIFFTAGIAGGAYFFLTNANVTPEKQIFSEEKPKEETPETANNQESKTEPDQTQAQQEEKKEQEEPVAKTEPEPKKEELPEGAYKARVTWSTGLSLRAEPSRDASRVGGVGYNSELIILSTSSDGLWQKVRIPSSGQEAWVKAGNVAEIEE